MSDLNTLFSRDPLSLTDENIDQIIEEMRAKRHLFQNGGGTSKPEPRKSKAVAEGEALQKKLGLDIKL